MVLEVSETQNAYWELWDSILKEKRKLFCADLGKVGQVEHGKFFKSGSHYCENFRKTLKAGRVDYIELPKAINTPEKVILAFYVALGDIDSSELFVVDDPVFQVPEGITVFGTFFDSYLWAFDGKALMRCVDKDGQYIRKGGEGFKAKRKRLEREEQERLAREAEEKRLAEERAEAERQERNLKKLASLDQSVFDRFMKMINR